MGQELPDSDLFLAELAELWPVRRNRLVESEQALRMGDGDRRRRHPLGSGEHRHHRVCLPPQPSCGVTRTTPQINDSLAVAVHSHGRTDLAAFAEVRPEHVGDGAEPIGDITTNPLVHPAAHSLIMTTSRSELNPQVPWRRASAR